MFQLYTIKGSMHIVTMDDCVNKRKKVIVDFGLPEL